MTVYSGPKDLKNDVQLALKALHQLISANIEDCKNHRVICLTGFESNNELIAAIAIYLTGAIAGCIDFHLNVRTALFDEVQIERDLYQDIVHVVGVDNTISKEKKQSERNPWFWEGISHLLLHLSYFDQNLHPPDKILAKSSIHLFVKDHGLDIIALYGDKHLGITAGECKAYLTRPADAITDSANKLHEIDHHLRDAEIRQTISQFQAGLPSEVRDRLTTVFWRDERAYFPMVCCDETSSSNWAYDRSVIKKLKRPPDRKFLVPVAIKDAESFFDLLADAMRKYARGNL